jgi:hypothetical protein
MSKHLIERIQDIRCELAGMEIKKSGHNKFAGYKYYELGDFLAPLMQLQQKHRVGSMCSFDKDYAHLSLFNLDEPEQYINVTSPFGSANLKAAHEIQNIGAVETYQRRYLYMTAYEIVEHDAVDASGGQATPQTNTRNQPQKPADPLARAAAEMKNALAELAKKADSAIVDGYKRDGAELYKAGDADGLERLVKEIFAYKPDEFADDILHF